LTELVKCVKVVTTAKNNIRKYIKSGGGTGPMKLSNRLERKGANSCQKFLGRCIHLNNLSLPEGFF
jgi:hypothetical protein